MQDWDNDQLAGTFLKLDRAFDEIFGKPRGSCNQPPDGMRPPAKTSDTNINRKKGTIS
jgi:hypothetical protein